jgi:hypothetical protein
LAAAVKFVVSNPPLQRAATGEIVIALAAIQQVASVRAPEVVIAGTPV